MNGHSCVAGVIVLLLSLGASGDSANSMDNEVLPVLLRVRSTDAAERALAVDELTGIREAVSIFLRAIVVEANDGAASNDAKASALFLMGRLGLWQCKDTLEAEQDWEWKTKPPARTSGRGRRYYQEKGRTPGAAALSAAAFGNNVTLEPSRSAASLSSYPLLSKALGDLRAGDPTTLRKAEDAVLAWYDAVTNGLASVIEKRKVPLYSKDVEIASAWLLGEYRAFWSKLASRMDITDEKGLTTGYPASVKVVGIDESLTSSVALLKCGRRIDNIICAHKLRSDRLNDTERIRLARAFVLIDADAATKAYDDCVNLVRSSPQASINPSADLARLAAVQDIFR